MKRKITKRKIPLIILLSLILIFLIGLLFAPTLLEGMEKNKLENEITWINDKINKETIDKKEIDTYFLKKLSSGRRKKVEKSLENYLNDVVNECNQILTITNDKRLIEALNTKTIEVNTYDFTQTIEILNQSKEILKTSKDKLAELPNQKEEYIKKNTKKEDLIQLYQDILKTNLDTNNYLKLSDTTTKNIEVTLEAINYLSNNRDNWKIEDNKLLFTKRKKLAEYNKIIENILDLEVSLPELIKDETPPNIEANNVTVTEGTSINVKEDIKCIDDVDDEIECNITGDYDTNKPGEYHLKIEAIDNSNNRQEKNITITVNQKIVYKAPYYTEVIRNQNTVIVYGLDENNEYTKIIRVMPCSTGREGQDTPTGTFTTSDKYRWGGLYGGVWGQYATRVVNDILFHSVPYYSENPGDLEWEEYNKLGSPASLGCIRMAVIDVKWLYENCPSGMTVKIYDGDLPTVVSKPSAQKIDGTSPNKGWDPTDPDANNPWNQ